MAHGTRGRGDGDVRDALDRCLTRMRRGESLDRCLADESSLSDELGPLLQLAESITDHVVEAPLDAAALGDMRLRFLDAACAVREADEHAAAAATTPADRAIAAALDGALAALADGASLDEALRPHGAHADALRPLLQLAASLDAAKIDPPTPPTRLERGRDRLLAAAADLRDAAELDAAHADGDASLADAVDTCIAELRLGASVDQVLDAHPRQAADLRPIASMAVRLIDDVVEPPPADLTKGLDKMLAAAQQARAPEGVVQRLTRAAAQQAREPVDFLQRLTGALAPGRALSLARLTAAAIALALIMGGGGLALAPAAASSLPGDSLYTMKRAGEQVRLALAFDPNTRQQLEADYSRERNREIDALLYAGRAGEVDRWQVRFRGFEDYTVDQGKRHGLLHVVLLDDPEETRSLQWNADTAFDLADRYASWRDVPAGARLVIKVLIQPDGAALALSVQVKASSDPDDTPTPTESSTPDGTAVPLSSETPDATETATLGTPSATATEPAATVTPIASIPPSPTASATRVSGAPSADVLLRATLRGMLSEKSSDATWLLIEEPRDRDAESPGTKVPVDVSDIEESERERVKVGDWVQLHGRWQDERRALFLARSIDRVRNTAGAVPARQCATHIAVGRVAGVDGQTSITLADGSAYVTTSLPPDALTAVRVGTRVEIVYQDCGDGQRVAQTIQVLDQPSIGVYQGTVHDPADSIFTLVTRRGTQYQVVRDADTRLIGAARLMDGQFVQVRGWEDEDSGVIHAIEVRVQSSETETPVPTATLRSTPGATATQALTVMATGTSSTLITPTPTYAWIPEGTRTPGSDAPGEVPPTMQVNR